MNCGECTSYRRLVGVPWKRMHVRWMREVGGLEDRTSQIRFSGLSEDNLTQIHKDRDLYISLSDQAAAAFYDAVQQVPELAQIIRKHTTVERLTITFKEYWRSLVEDPIDDKYIETRLAVGRRHSEIGLLLQWYQGAFGLLSRLITEALSAKYREDPDGFLPALSAITARINFDMQLAVETYVSGQFNQVQKIQTDVSSVAEQLRGIAQANRMVALNASIEAARAGEHGAGFGVVAGEIRRMADQTADASKTILQMVNKFQSR